MLLGAIGFSAKPTLVKLGYQYDVDVMTLLALRMLCSLPFFAAMALWTRSATVAARLTRGDWLAVLGEPVTAVQIAGAALVLVGVGLVSVRPKAAASP